jgi:hypothetical protein
MIYSGWYTLKGIKIRLGRPGWRCMWGRGAGGPRRIRNEVL